MNDNLEDTKPRPALRVPDEPSEIQAPAPMPPQRTAPRPVSGQSPYRDLDAPPRFLLWGVIGIFVLGIVAVIGSVVIFRSVLEPGQQERIIQVLPFMEAFLPPRPAPNDTLPTPEGGSADNISPEDLLQGLNLSGSTPDINPTDVPTGEPTVQATATLEPSPEPTQVVTLEATVQPTIAPTLEPSQEAAVVPTLQSQQVIAAPAAVTNTTLARSARLNGFNYQKQTWNNCGPSNVTMALSYYGWQRDQTYAADFLKPGGREDKNVSPSELVRFVNEQSSVLALSRMGGTVDLLRTLLANNFPIIVESGFMPEGYEWLGHYRTLVGYDDNQGVFWIYDSFLGNGTAGEGIAENFPAFDTLWRQFNRTFIVVYEPQRETELMNLLGEAYVTEDSAAQIALDHATVEANNNRSDGHAWFNLGTSLAQLGNYDRAASAFDRARREGVPWRMTWYQFGPFVAYYGAGRFQEVLTLAEANLANGGEYVEESYYWQGRALEALGRANEAATAFRSALRRNPQYADARDALTQMGL
jgi:tetratricopeptide (TPR) repeat protein